MIYGNVVKQYERNSYGGVLTPSYNSIDESSYILESLYKEQDNYSNLLEYCIDDNEREILEAKYEVITEAVGAAIIAAIIGVLIAIGGIILVIMGLFRKGASKLASECKNVENKLKAIVEDNKKIADEILSTNPTKVTNLCDSADIITANIIMPINGSMRDIEYILGNVRKQKTANKMDVRSAIKIAREAYHKEFTDEEFLNSMDQFINSKDEIVEESIKAINGMDPKHNSISGIVYYATQGNKSGFKMLHDMIDTINKAVRDLERFKQTRVDKVTSDMESIKSDKNMNISNEESITLFKIISNLLNNAKADLNATIETFKECIKFDNHVLQVIKKYATED